MAWIKLKYGYDEFKYISLATKYFIRSFSNWKLKFDSCYNRQILWMYTFWSMRMCVCESWLGRICIGFSNREMRIPLIYMASWNSFMFTCFCRSFNNLHSWCWATSPMERYRWRGRDESKEKNDLRNIIVGHLPKSYWFCVNRSHVSIYSQPEIHKTHTIQLIWNIVSHFWF